MVKRVLIQKGFIDFGPVKKVPRGGFQLSMCEKCGVIIGDDEKAIEHEKKCKGV